MSVANTKPSVNTPTPRPGLSALLPEAGYTLVRPGQKAPIGKGWQNTPHPAKEAGAHLFTGGSIGLLCGYADDPEDGYYYLLDLDKDAFRAYGCPHLEGALYIWRDNALDRVKVAFRCKDKLPGQKLHNAGVELLGVGNHGVIAGVHSSGALIQWDGDEIPLLEAQTVETILADWTEGESETQHRQHREPGPPDAEAVKQSVGVVEAFMKHAKLQHTGAQEYDGTGRKFVLKTCPFNPDDNPHADDAAAAIMVFADGRIGATCHHARCQEIIEQQPSGWKYLQDKYEFHQKDPLPEGATVTETGTVVIKRLPDIEYTPPPEPPPLTVELANFYRTWAQTPACGDLIRKHARNVEAYRTALIKLIDVGAAVGSWTFDAARDWLGEQLGKSGQAAQKNAVKLERMGLIRYLHGPADDERTGRPVRRIDLTPLLGHASLKLHNPLEASYATLDTRGELDVYRRYVGSGPYGDATMRVNKRTVVEYSKIPFDELLPTLTHACLPALEYMQTLPAGTMITRKELCEATGLSPGSAAGAMRRLEELDHITSEWDGPFTPKYYGLKTDWQPRLDSQVKRMKSHGARDRLVIRNLARQISWLEYQQRAADRQQYMELENKKRKLASARATWCVHAGKRGTYRPRARQQQPHDCV